MMVLRRAIAAILLSTGPALATPSSVVEAIAGCIGRLEAGFAPPEEIETLEQMLARVMPAALDWGMPASHVTVVRGRAWQVQRTLQNSAILSDDPRAKRNAQAAAAGALAKCRAMLPRDTLS
jgi:hypothetical protein